MTITISFLLDKRCAKPASLVYNTVTITIAVLFGLLLPCTQWVSQGIICTKVVFVWCFIHTWWCRPNTCSFCVNLGSLVLTCACSCSSCFLDAFARCRLSQSRRLVLVLLLLSLGRCWKNTCFCYVCFVLLCNVLLIFFDVMLHSHTFARSLKNTWFHLY